MLLSLSPCISNISFQSNTLYYFCKLLSYLCYYINILRVAQHYLRFEHPAHRWASFEFVALQTIRLKLGEGFKLLGISMLH